MINLLKKYNKQIVILFSCYVLVFFILFMFSYIIYSEKLIDSYESGNVVNDYSGSISLKYNDGSIPFEKSNTNSDLDEFNSCYVSKINKDDFSEELRNKYNDIENYFKASDVSVSFSYEDLYTGLNISYNENQNYFSASAIKSPVITYIYMLYLDGKIGFDEVLTYTSSYYVEGSGSIQYDEFGTQYKISELIRKTVVDSDNVAYQMLASRVYNTGIMDYWRNLGATTFWTNGSVWGQINSHDGVIYMKQLYKLINDNPSIRDELLGYYYNSVARLIQLDDDSIKIAHKSGWNSASIHDLAVIYDKHPYVLAITSLKGYSGYEEFFKEASNLIYDFHKSYWEQKASYCYQKSFK